MNTEPEGEFVSLQYVSLAATFGSLLPWMTHVLPGEVRQLWTPLANDTDSSDRERLEVAVAALHISERLVRQFFDDSPISVAVVDSAGRLLQFNRAFGAMLGCAMEDLLERTIDDLVHPDDVASVREHRRQLVEGRSEGFAIETRFATAARPEVWTRMTAQLEHIGPDRAPYVFAHIVELPELRHVERRRRHPEPVPLRHSDP